MGFGTIALLGMLATPGQVPADVTPWNTPSIKLPIDYNPAAKKDIRDLLLYVSADQGTTWQQQAVASPDKDKEFIFNAPADGHYWFCMVVVDKTGKREPADVYKVPATQIFKVLFDTKRPVVTLTSATRNGDDVAVTWKVIEKNPDWSKFRLEYSVAGSSWTPVSTRPEADGSAQFRVNGAGALAIRLSLTDVGGLTGEGTKEIAAAPINIAAKPMNNAELLPAAGTNDLPPPSTLLGNSGGDRNKETPKTPVATDKSFGLDTPTAPGVVAPTGPAPTIPNIATPGTDPIALPTKSDASTVSPAVVNANLPPAQVINVTSFKLGFEVEERGASGVGKAELYVTRDEGRTWTKWQTFEKPESPLVVDLTKNNNLNVEGIYGLKLLLHSGAGLTREAPKGGDLPDYRVDVDVNPPAVMIYEPQADLSSKDTMILKWKAIDRNMAIDPITLEWSESPQGPWTPLATTDNLGASPGQPKRLPNTGSFNWKIPANFPTHKIYLKVSARDLAGNLSEATTKNAILVDLNKPTAVKLNILGGISK